MSATLPGFSSRFTVGIAAAVATALAVVFALPAGGARSAAQPGLIAFARADGVYVMHADGSAIRSLRRGGVTAGAFDLAWSPDGLKLAFAGSDAIWVMNADGSHLVRLVGAGDARGEAPGSLASPTWAPDGRRLALSAGYRADRDVWLVNADGSNLRRLARTRGFGRDYRELDVDWSPAGARLAFSGVAFQGIHLMGVNGSVVRSLPAQMFGWMAWEGMPDWSPDGRRIAFMQKTTGAVRQWPGRTGISVMDVSDGSRVQLTRSTAVDVEPVWSPDGKRILFVRSDAWPRSKNSELYVMNADGSGVARLTHNRVAEGSPAWQPLGREER